MDEVVEIRCMYYGFTVTGPHTDDYLALMKEEGYFGNFPKVSLGNHTNRGVKYHVIPKHFLRIFLDWLLVQRIGYTCTFYDHHVSDLCSRDDGEHYTVVEDWSPPPNQQHAIENGYLDDVFSATPAWRPNPPDF